jgi:hypothetical protein
MALFQTDRGDYDIGSVHIKGFQYSTEDPDKIAFLRRNLSEHLWEVKLGEMGEVVGIGQGDAMDNTIQTEVVGSEVLIKNRDFKTPPRVKMRRGMRTSEVLESKEEKQT